MPLETAELLEPIPGANPGGASLRYDPVYDQIRRARIEEEDLPSGEWERERKTADYGLVIKLSADVLARQSKDLQIAVWMTEALLKREGFGGLAAGLDLIRQLLEGFWDHLYPELEDGDAEFRAAPLVWVGQYLDRAVRLVPIVQSGHDMAAYQDSRAVGYQEDATTYEARDARSAAIAAGKLTAEEFDEAFGATPKSWYRQLLADIEGALSALDAVDAVSEEKFAGEAPRFAPLGDAIREVRQAATQLLARKLEKEPDPVEVVSAAPDAAGTRPDRGDGAGSPGGAASHTVSVPGVFTGTPAPAAVGGRGGAEAGIAAAARFLRAESPTDPGAHLLLRGFRWGELRAGGGAIDPLFLAAPPTDVRTRLRTLLVEERWAELLEASEEVMATPFGRGWLDLQRYVVTAAEALGADYRPVADAIRSALRSLLHDLPDLTALTLADDTATANAETRAWLRGHQLLPDATGQPREEAPPPPRTSRFDPLVRARELAAAGKHDQAVDVLMREAAQERSPRGRFLRRTQAASILVDAGRETVAMPILEELAEEIEQHGLEAWEDPETIAHPLGLLYRCTVAMEGEGTDSQRLFVRVCRLDPIQAMKFGPATRAG